jgi:hypothetical protein
VNGRSGSQIIYSHGIDNARSFWRVHHNGRDSTAKRLPPPIIPLIEWNLVSVRRSIFTLPKVCLTGLLGWRQFCSPLPASSGSDRVIRWPALSDLSPPARWECSRVLVCFSLLALVSVPIRAQENSSVAFPKDRYATLRSRSPFGLATAPSVVVAPQSSFATNWYVSGIARIGNDDFVTIKSRDQAVQFSLFGREPEEPSDPNSVALVSVTWSDAVGKSTVILRKGTETAKLEFNEAQLRGPIAAATAGAAPPVTGKPVTPTSAVASNAAIHRRNLPIPQSR